MDYASDHLVRQKPDEEDYDCPLYVTLDELRDRQETRLFSLSGVIIRHQYENSQSQWRRIPGESDKKLSTKSHGRKCFKNPIKNDD